MASGSSSVIPWRVDGPTTLHGFDDDLVYMLVCADTDDPDLQRQIALVSAWDREGESYAQLIVAAPKLLAACQAVVDRWDHGDLAEAAWMCDEAVRLAAAVAVETRSTEPDADPDRLVARAEAAGLTAEDLDETVHELANGIAADINNAGLEDQIRYLIGEWGSEAAAREIDRLAEERSEDRNQREARKHGQESAEAEAAL